MREYYDVQAIVKAIMSLLQEKAQQEGLKMGEVSLDISEIIERVGSDAIIFWTRLITDMTLYELRKRGFEVKYVFEPGDITKIVIGTKSFLSFSPPYPDEFWKTIPL